MARPRRRTRVASSAPSSAHGARRARAPRRDIYRNISLRPSHARRTAMRASRDPRRRRLRAAGDAIDAIHGARIAWTTMASIRPIAVAHARGHPRGHPRAVRRISRHQPRGASRPWSRRALRATATSAPRPPIARWAHRRRRRLRRAPAPVRAPTCAPARASACVVPCIFVFFGSTLPAMRPSCVACRGVRSHLARVVGTAGAGIQILKFTSFFVEHYCLPQRGTRRGADDG